MNTTPAGTFAAPSIAAPAAGRRAAQGDPKTLERALSAIRCAEDKKAEAVLGLDVRSVCSFTDAFIICTGSSPAQVRAIAENITDGLGRQGSGKPMVEGEDAFNWVVLDYGDVVVHVMSPEARTFYNLEGLWGDAPEIRKH